MPPKAPVEKKGPYRYTGCGLALFDALSSMKEEGLISKREMDRVMENFDVVFENVMIDKVLSQDLPSPVVNAKLDNYNFNEDSKWVDGTDASVTMDDKELSSHRVKARFSVPSSKS